MKRLALSALLVLLPLVALPQKNQTSAISKQAKPQNSQEVPQPLATPSESSPAIHNNTTNNGADHEGVGHDGLFYLTLVLAGCGIVQAFAAVRSANAVQSGERAWVVVEGVTLNNFGTDDIIRYGHKPSFSYSFKNYGKTPAIVRAIDVRFEASNSQELPPDPSAFRVKDFATKFLIPSLDSRPDSKVLVISEGTLVQCVGAVRVGVYFLWAYGVIKYDDVFGRRRETRFCFRSGVNKSVDVILEMGGPAEYNDAK